MYLAKGVPPYGILDRAKAQKKGKNMLGKQNQKEYTVSFRVTAEEISSLDRRCYSSGLSRSQWLRMALRRQNITIIDGAAPILKKVILLGNNLNQLNRSLNSHASVNVKEELDYLNSTISEIKQQLMELRSRCLMTQGKESINANYKENEQPCKAPEDYQVYSESSENVAGVSGNEWL